MSRSGKAWARTSFAEAVPRAIAKTDKDESGCWNLIRGRKRMADRYPAISFEGRSERANRAVWRFYNGPIPKGMLVCHRCDNVDCINPGHLFLGTTRDNARDMAAKGRARGGSLPECLKHEYTEQNIFRDRRGRRVSHCRHGHEFTPENTDLNRAGNRVCRTCRDEMRARRAA